MRRALGGIGDRVLRLPLGADEQDAPAAGDRVADRLQRPVQHRHRLRKVDDVDVGADAEDVLGHLRIPAMGLMAEMRASLQQLAHRELGKRHVDFSGYAAADAGASVTLRSIRSPTGRPEGQMSACGMAAI